MRRRCGTGCARSSNSPWPTTPGPGSSTPTGPGTRFPPMKGVNAQQALQDLAIGRSRRRRDVEVLHGHGALRGDRGPSRQPARRRQLADGAGDSLRGPASPAGRPRRRQRSSAAGRHPAAGATSRSPEPAGIAAADAIVRAAGGAVWRRAGNGELEVVLVHRARYDDWSLPKGKVDPGETDEQAALRGGPGGVQRRGSPRAGAADDDLPGPQRQAETGALLGHDASPAGKPPAPTRSTRPPGSRWPRPGSRLTYARDVAVLDALTGRLDGRRGP